MSFRKNFASCPSNLSDPDEPSKSQGGVQGIMPEYRYPRSNGGQPRSERPAKEVDTVDRGWLWLSAR
jgi:hypothetical protein